MKNALFLLLVSASIISCEKFDSPASEDPKVISVDTLRSGQKWGLVIGDSCTDVYAALQELEIAEGLDYLGIASNVFTRLEDIEARIPLYTSVFLDETQATTTGIQIYYSDNKVKSIWMNNGMQLTRWPLDTDSSAAISVNLPVDSIYNRLVNIRSNESYAKLFQRISIFYKNLETPYDPHMKQSAQWHFGFGVNSARFYQVILNFSSGRLSSMIYTLYENP